MKTFVIALVLGMATPLCVYGIASLAGPQLKEELALLLLPGFLVMWALPGYGEAFEIFVLFAVNAVAWGFVWLPVVLLVGRLRGRNLIQPAGSHPLARGTVTRDR